MSRKSAFIYVLKLVKGEPHEFSPKEEAVIKEHFDRLKKALAEGRLILAGPCNDRAFGIVVFKAQSSEEAEKFMQEDPAVKRGLMTAELHPFHVSLVQSRQC